MVDSKNEDFRIRCNAYHEAGHAVAALKHGFQLVKVDIRQIYVDGLGDTFGGAELHLPVPRELMGQGEEAVMPILVVLFAGVFSEQRINPNAGLDTGHAQSDFQRLWRYAMCAVCTPIEINGEKKIPRDDIRQNGPRINSCIQLARQKTISFVDEHGLEIDAVGNLLAKETVLSSEQVELAMANLIRDNRTSLKKDTNRR